MNPPQHLIDLMLVGGRPGLLVSMLCLSAAYAVKRGESIDDLEIQHPITHEPLPAEMQAVYHATMRACYEELKAGTPSDVDHAIALYTGHLKAAGYSVEVGHANN